MIIGWRVLCERPSILDLPKSGSITELVGKNEWIDGKNTLKTARMGRQAAKRKRMKNMKLS